MAGEDEDHINQSEDHRIRRISFVEKGKSYLECIKRSISNRNNSNYTIKEGIVTPHLNTSFVNTAQKKKRKKKIRVSRT